MGGRGSAGSAKITFAQALEYSKQVKSLNQRIGRLQSEIKLAHSSQETVASLFVIKGAAKARKQLETAAKKESENKRKLVELQEQKESIEKKLRRYQKQR